MKAGMEFVPGKHFLPDRLVRGNVFSDRIHPYRRT
jgi:hypothetical protein